MNILHYIVHVKGRRTAIVLGKGRPMMTSRIAAAALIVVSVAACDKKPPAAAEVRPVRAVTVDHGAEGEIISLTGRQLCT